MVTKTESQPKALQKVWTMAETTEAKSPPKGMGSLRTAQTTTVLANASPKESLKLSEKAQTRRFLKAARTSTAPANASRKEPLKTDWIAMEPGKMMVLVKAPWKLTVSVKEPTEAGPMELASQPMASQKVQTMSEPKEIEN